MAHSAFNLQLYIYLTHARCDLFLIYRLVKLLLERSTHGILKPNFITKTLYRECNVMTLMNET